MRENVCRCYERVGERVCESGCYEKICSERAGYMTPS